MILTVDGDRSAVLSPQEYTSLYPVETRWKALVISASPSAISTHWLSFHFDVLHCVSPIVRLISSTHPFISVACGVLRKNCDAVTVVSKSSMTNRKSHHSVCPLGH